MERFDVVEGLFESVNKNDRVETEKTMLVLNYLLPNIFLDGLNLIESGQIAYIDSPDLTWLFCFNDIYTNASRKICSCSLFIKLKYLQNIQSPYCPHLVASTLVRLGIFNLNDIRKTPPDFSNE